jgi:hypothetical protein
MSLNIETEDRYIYKKNQLLIDLFTCHRDGIPIVIDLMPEGPCAHSLGLYDLLDQFCQATSTEPESITIKTANMLEHHDRYNIIKCSQYWFEIPSIQTWWNNNKIDTGNSPTKHFGNFVGRSRWPRLWMSAWLDKYHGSRVLQTFHSSLRCHYRTESDDQVYDWLGLEDLVQNDCDMIKDVIDFLERCPKIIEEDLDAVKSSRIIVDQPTHYPLQHPANLNIVRYYKHIFVDVIVEPNMYGNCFLSTEKLWRCILAKRPFIMISNRDHLYNLHKLGFETFHQWWDEDYDGYENQNRIKMVQLQLDQIAEWTQEELELTLFDMRKKLDHNYDVFLSLNDNKFVDVFGAA